MKEFRKQWTTRKEIRKRPVIPMTSFFPMEDCKKIPDLLFIMKCLRKFGLCRQMYNSKTFLSSKIGASFF
jgi:hypothetical protein